MAMKINKTLGSLFLLASLGFVSPVFAGGQMTSLEADSYGSTNSDGTYGRIMRVVTQVRPCEGTVLTFKFVDPKEGDYIMTTSGNATFVFTKDSQPYYQDGELVCGTTAKMGSKVLGERDVTVIVQDTNGVSIDSPPVIKVDFDGKYHPDNSYNGYNYSSSQDHPSYRLTHPQQTSNPTPTQGSSVGIYAWVLNQQTPALGSDNRSVVIKWSAFDGNPGTFTIYGRPASRTYVRPDSINNWDKLLEGQKGPSADLNITTEDYYLKVYGCQDKWGNCVYSNALFLPKVQKQDGNTITSPNPGLSVSASPNTNDKKVDELDKKVRDLQNQLDQSKKNQSFLEQRISYLVNFIKQLFPFFK